MRCRDWKGYFKRWSGLSSHLSGWLVHSGRQVCSPFLQNELFLPPSSFLSCLSASFFFPIFPSGQGLLSQSALQLNNQESYAAAGYHNNQGLESVTGRSGQVGGAVHIYNQVNACGTNCMTSFPCDFERFCHVSETVSHFIELLKEAALFAWAVCRRLCPETGSDSRLS